MEQAELLPSLNLMTLIGIVLIATIGLFLFLRKRSNKGALKHPDDEVIATVKAPDNRP